MNSNSKKETADTEEDIEYSSGSEGASEVEHEATETLVSPNQTVEHAQPAEEPAKKSAPRKQRKKSAAGTVTDATNVLNTAGQVVDTATKTIQDPLNVVQQPLGVLDQANPAQTVQPVAEGVQNVVQTGKKSGKGDNPISLRLGGCWIHKLCMLTTSNTDLNLELEIFINKCYACSRFLSLTHSHRRSCTAMFASSFWHSLAYANLNSFVTISF